MTIFDILDYAGVLAFSISGVSTAASKKLDLFGGIIIAYVTALGGGTIRDILLDVPVSWMDKTEYLHIVLFGALLAIIFKDRTKKIRKSLFLFDTIGIGLFTVIGVQKALEYDASYEVAVILGVITATFGGVIRDILCNEIPLIFRKEIYATACVSGAIVFCIGKYFGLEENINLIISCITISSIRFLAVYKNIRMPLLNSEL